MCVKHCESIFLIQLYLHHFQRQFQPLIRLFEINQLVYRNDITVGVIDIADDVGDRRAEKILHGMSVFILGERIDQRIVGETAVFRAAVIILIIKINNAAFIKASNMQICLHQPNTIKLQLLL